MKFSILLYDLSVNAHADSVMAKITIISIMKLDKPTNYVDKWDPFVDSVVGIATSFETTLETNMAYERPVCVYLYRWQPTQFAHASCHFPVKRTLHGKKRIRIGFLFKGRMWIHGGPYNLFCDNN